MSTRSMIGICKTDGKVRAIYCHHDGYLEYNGRVLFEDYKNKEKVEQLIALGDISSLDGDLRGVRAYARDCGEKLHFVEYESVKLFLEDCAGDCMIEWCYYFDANTCTWYVADACRNTPGWKRLSAEMEKIYKAEAEAEAEAAGGE